MKSNLECKLRLILAPSWLVRAQVGAKRDKLTLLGGLRGTKLELKRALGAAKRAPRVRKSGTTGIEESWGGLCLGRVPLPK